MTNIVSINISVEKRRIMRFGRIGIILSYILLKCGAPATLFFRFKVK